MSISLSREEIFGPVAPLIRFKTEEEAINLANDTNAGKVLFSQNTLWSFLFKILICIVSVGLAAYIFTNSIQRSWRVTEALEYGLVGVNEGVISTEVSFTWLRHNICIQFLHSILIFGYVRWLHLGGWNSLVLAEKVQNTAWMNIRRYNAQLFYLMINLVRVRALSKIRYWLFCLQLKYVCLGNMK